MHFIPDKIRTLEDKLQKLEEEKAILQGELVNAHRELENLEKNKLANNSRESIPPVIEKNLLFSTGEKIKIFMNLFRGRTDVFPKKWDNSKTGKSGYSPTCFNEWVQVKCNKPKIKCSDCPNQAFIPLTEEVIRKHLGGEDYRGSKRNYTVGIYPMLKDDTCWFLAADFDKENWQRDAGGFIKTCHQKNVPFALERSRSGNGGHVWIFFENPIPASQARKLGSALLTETMETYPDIGFE